MLKSSPHLSQKLLQQFRPLKPFVPPLGHPLFVAIESPKTVHKHAVLPSQPEPLLHKSMGRDPPTQSALHCLVASLRFCQYAEKLRWPGVSSYYHAHDGTYAWWVLTCHLTLSLACPVAMLYMTLHHVVGQARAWPHQL